MGTRQRAQQLAEENEKLLPIEETEHKQQTQAHAVNLIELLRKQNERLEAKLDQNQLTSTSQIEHLQQQIEQLRKQNEQLQKQNESSEAKVDQMIEILKSLKVD